MRIILQGYNVSHTASRLCAMAKPTYSAIVRLAGQLQPKPALVFVPTRKQSRLTGQLACVYGAFTVYNILLLC